MTFSPMAAMDVLLEARGKTGIDHFTRSRWIARHNYVIDHRERRHQLCSGLLREVGIGGVCNFNDQWCPRSGIRLKKPDVLGEQGIEVALHPTCLCALKPLLDLSRGGDF